jgi:hypothetical protein
MAFRTAVVTRLLAHLFTVFQADSKLLASRLLPWPWIRFVQRKHPEPVYMPIQRRSTIPCVYTTDEI